MTKIHTYSIDNSRLNALETIQIVDIKISIASLSLPHRFPVPQTPPDPRRIVNRNPLSLITDLGGALGGIYTSGAPSRSV